VENLRTTLTTYSSMTVQNAGTRLSEGRADKKTNTDLEVSAV
jgi:hypothetical protein